MYGETRRDFENGSVSHGPVVENSSRTRLQFVALLIVDRESEVFPNLRRASDAGAVYLGCAALLAKSADAAGHDIMFVTNDAGTVMRAFARLQVPETVRIEERGFVSSLPLSAPHRAAHHKLDLLRDLAGAEGDRIHIVIDLDTVVLRPLRHDELPGANEIGAYDITGMMLSESAGRSVDDLRRVAGRSSAHSRWFGGEMLAASPIGFAELSVHLAAMQDRYAAERADLYHSGDEAPVSAALNAFVEQGGLIRDLGQQRSIVRWWTAVRSFAQPRLTDVLDRAVLHLPADKEFLSSVAGQPFDPARFVRAYRRYARPKLFLRRLKRLGRLGASASMPSHVASL